MHRVALLVATYEYEDPTLRPLVSPRHDAEALAAVLRDPHIAGFEVTTLINEPHDRVGKAIGNFYADLRRDDVALLYFTGHGLKDDDGKLYLAMTNTQKTSLLFTSIGAEQIDQAMARCRSRRQVLVLDCCYSGAFPAGGLAKADDDVHTLERFSGRGRAILTASDATQYAFEGDTLHGGASPSIFTQYLVEGLRDGTADLDGDGDITVEELHNYVLERVVEHRPQQRPKRVEDVDGPIVLATNVHWGLPPYLRDAIDSPLQKSRHSAVEALIDLYRGGNTVVRNRVAQELRRLADDDSKSVSAAAVAWLASPESDPVPPEIHATAVGPTPAAETDVDTPDAVSDPTAGLVRPSVDVPARVSVTPSTKQSTTHPYMTGAANPSADTGEIVLGQQGPRLVRGRSARSERLEGRSNEPDRPHASDVAVNNAAEIFAASDGRVEQVGSVKRQPPHPSEGSLERTASVEHLGALRYHTMLVSGLLSVLLGILMLGWPRPTLNVIGGLLGLYVLLAVLTGVATVYLSIAIRAGRSRVVLFVGGAVSIVFGVLVFVARFATSVAAGADPVIAPVVDLALVIAGALTLRGVVHTAMAVADHEMPGRRWVIVLGVTILIAAVAFLVAPFTLVVSSIEILAGVLFFVVGACEVIASMAQRKATEASLNPK